jgi:RimJ/RimL family protein N-acetyltransferase
VNWREVVLRRGAVEVRASREADGEVIGTSPRDPVTGRFFGRALSGPPPGTEDPEAPAFTILRDGRPVGRVWFRPGARPFEVGYYVRPDLWGKGVATTALSLVSEWFLENVEPEIVLFTHPENIGSQKVAERAGFVADGSMSRYAEFEDGTTAALRFVRRASEIA